MGRRITCRTPSTGKPLRMTIADVSDSYATLIEAPDFSVPDTSNKFDARDSADIGRAIRPGEIFFLTPLAVKNKDSADHWLDTRLVQEDGIVIELGRIDVPAGDTGFVPIQGRSLLKRILRNSSDGDQLQIRADASGVIDVWTAGEEKLSSEHTGVE